MIKQKANGHMDSKKTKLPIGVGLAGAAAGAALGSAAAVILSRAENRKKVGQAFDDIRHEAADIIHDIRSGSTPLQRQAAERFEDGKRLVQMKGGLAKAKKKK